jgi:cytochrome c-type biogenesis protein CcmH/NrfG
VVSLTPDDASAWNELGLIQARQRRHTDAVEAFVRALRAEPRHAAACENGRRAAAAAHQRRPEIDACGRDTRS